jgi:hypothetical protein
MEEETVTVDLLGITYAALYFTVVGLLKQSSERNVSQPSIISNINVGAVRQFPVRSISHTVFRKGHSTTDAAQFLMVTNRSAHFYVDNASRDDRKEATPMHSSHLEFLENELPKLPEAVQLGSERLQTTDCGIVQSEANRQDSIHLALTKSDCFDESNAEVENVKVTCQASLAVGEKPSFVVDKPNLLLSCERDETIVENCSQQDTVEAKSINPMRKESLHTDVLCDVKRCPSYQWTMSDESKQVNKRRHLSSRRHHHTSHRQQQQQHDNNVTWSTSRAHSGGRRMPSSRVGRRKGHDTNACDATSCLPFLVNRDDLPNTVGLAEERSSMIDVIGVNCLTVTNEHSADELDSTPNSEGTSEVHCVKAVEPPPLAVDVDAGRKPVGYEKKIMATPKAVPDRTSSVEHQTTAEVPEVAGSDTRSSDGNTSRQLAKIAISTGASEYFQIRNFLGTEATIEMALADKEDGRN